MWSRLRHPSLPPSLPAPVLSPPQAVKEFVRRTGVYGTTTFITGMLPHEAKAAHVLIAALKDEFPSTSIPEAFTALNQGSATISQRKMRSGAVDVGPEPLPARTPDPDVQVTKTNINTKLVYALVMSGPVYDRGMGPTASSTWVMPVCRFSLFCWLEGGCFWNRASS